MRLQFETFHFSAPPLHSLHPMFRTRQRRRKKRKDSAEYAEISLLRRSIHLSRMCSFRGCSRMRFHSDEWTLNAAQSRT